MHSRSLHACSCIGRVGLVSYMIGLVNNNNSNNSNNSSSVCDGPTVVRRRLCLRRVASQAELLPTHCGECVARDVFLVDGRLHCCASRCSCASRVASPASYCPRRRPVSPRSGVLFMLGGADFAELVGVGCWRSLSCLALALHQGRVRECGISILVEPVNSVASVSSSASCSLRCD